MWGLDCNLDHSCTGLMWGLDGNLDHSCTGLMWGLDCNLTWHRLDYHNKIKSLTVCPKACYVLTEVAQADVMKHRKRGYTVCFSSLFGMSGIKNPF